MNWSPEEITPTPTFRSYPQVNSLLPSDLFVFDRLGQGTLGIEAINFTGSSGPTGPTGPESGNLIVQDTLGNVVTDVDNIIFAGGLTVSPTSGTGTATVTGGNLSGNLSVYDTTGDSATLVTSITFDGAQIIPPSGTGTAFVQVNSAFFVGSSD